MKHILFVVAVIMTAKVIALHAPAIFKSLSEFSVQHEIDAANEELRIAVQSR